MEFTIMQIKQMYDDNQMIFIDGKYQTSKDISLLGHRFGWYKRISHVSSSCITSHHFTMK